MPHNCKIRLIVRCQPSRHIHRDKYIESTPFGAALPFLTQKPGFSDSSTITCPSGVAFVVTCCTMAQKPSFSSALHWPTGTCSSPIAVLSWTAGEEPCGESPPIDHWNCVIHVC